MGWQLDEASEAMDRYEQKIGELEAEIERLEAYTRHHDHCSCMTPDGASSAPCDCGLRIGAPDGKIP